MILARRTCGLALVGGLIASSMISAAERPSAGRAPLSAVELMLRIDAAIQAKLDVEKIATSSQADDAEFIRRVTLDLHGVVPTAERVVAFLENREPDKRAALVDELLGRTEYGRNFGMIWFNRMVPRAARATGMVNDTLQSWLAEGFNQNRGWDAIVRDILLSEGPLSENPATNFFLAAAAGARDLRPAPDKVAAAVTRLFLGLRLECCQCHNHPFNELKQTDFWETAAFFVNVRAGVDLHPDRRPPQDPVLREGVLVAGVKSVKPRDIVPISTASVIEIPESNGKKVQARFLHGEVLEPQSGPLYRPAFAAWLTAPTNRQFARAAVNRMWAHFFGQGLVDPVDDMQPEHPATHPELLDLLTDEFIASGFDLKHLIRAIANTQAYGRTSAPLAGRDHNPQSYAHMAARVLTADQLYDSLALVLRRPVGEHIANGGQKRKYGDSRERFRIYFHGAGGDDNTPVPAYGHGIPQVLRIMNSPSLTDGTKLLDELMRFRTMTRADVVDRLYLTTLARYPTSPERSRAETFLNDEPDVMKGYSDLLWVLLNSGEFLHNH